MDNTHIEDLCLLELLKSQFSPKLDKYHQEKNGNFISLVVVNSELLPLHQLLGDLF